MKTFFIVVSDVGSTFTGSSGTDWDARGGPCDEVIDISRGGENKEDESSESQLETQLSGYLSKNQKGGK